MAADPATDLRRFLEGWVASGEVTAAFAAIATPERTLWSAGAAGGGAAAPSAASLFDAASLTKPWMATLALRLDASGELPLETRLAEVWPACAEPLAHRPLADLLRHRAGLEAWTPLYRRCRSRPAAEKLLLSGQLVAPPPRRQRYSDLDFILWGFAAEQRLGAGLLTLLRREVLGPLGVTGVEAAPGPRQDVVACRCDTEREVELAARQGLRIARRGPPALGEPQDGNARFLGGLGAHAGLFVSAEALLALGREWLAALGGAGGVLPAAGAREALSGSGEYALGWARRRVRGSAGPALSPQAFGHIGFTGPSLWIDPQRRTIFVLLAHRSGVESQLGAARWRFHALATALAGADGGQPRAPEPRLGMLNSRARHGGRPPRRAHRTPR